MKLAISSFLIFLSAIALFVNISLTHAAVPGDANGDNKVDGSDFVIWLNHYGQSASGGATIGDFDISGTVDGVDFTIWLSNYGRTTTPTPGGGTTGTPAPTGSGGIWKPALNTSWQWQLTGLPVDQSVDAQMYDIDLFENDASVVASLHAKGRKVVCYMSAGTWENWRPDAGQFPSSVQGSGNGWPGEKWLDVRNLAVLGPIMQARMDLCKQKGFDALEPDNIDGYTNSTGFPLTAQDQITYNRFLATEAHKRGLSIGLKNDIDQVPQLVNDFDWTLNEQCFQYSECNTLLPFIQAGKAVFNAEYSLSTSQFCPQANSMNFNSIKKDLNLTASRQACR